MIRELVKRRRDRDGTAAARASKRRTAQGEDVATDRRHAEGQPAQDGRTAAGRPDSLGRLPNAGTPNGRAGITLDGRSAGPWDGANNVVVEGGRPGNAGVAADPYGETANARRRRRLASFQALSLLWRYSSLDRVRKCRRFVVRRSALAGIAVRWNEARAHFAGLQTCGSVWTCPCCSERILAGRVDELLEAIETHRAAGGDVVMVTLTMRHDRGQGLELLWDAVGKAWTAATNTTAVRGLLRGVSWARRVEVTHGDAHGWHVHVHALLFVEAGRDHEAIGQAMFMGWARRLVGLGLAAPLRDHGGLNVKLLDLRAARADVAEYLAKGQYDGTDARRRAALELASSGKVGRGGNRTPMQILADMVSMGEARDFALWDEWEQGSHGRRSLTWSRGARARLVAEEERDDDELAQETDGDGELVALIEHEAVGQLMARTALKASVLTIAETSADAVEAYERIDRLLSRAGLPHALRRPPPRRE